MQPPRPIPEQTDFLPEEFELIETVQHCSEGIETRYARLFVIAFMALLSVFLFRLKARYFLTDFVCTTLFQALAMWIAIRGRFFLGVTVSFLSFFLCEMFFSPGVVNWAGDPFVIRIKPWPWIR